MADEKAKHTAGPWTLDANPYQATIWGKTAKGDMKIADLRGWGHLVGVGGLNLPAEQAAEIQDANGRLIAAAPELLEACHAICNVIVNAGPASLEAAINAAYNQCRSAIAKAEGRNA
jgi:hypothetical protein